jgi:hypothetical protein
VNSDLLDAIIHLGSQARSFGPFAQKLGVVIGVLVFGHQVGKLVQRAKNPHTGAVGGNLLAMAIASLLTGLSIWGQWGFSTVSGDEFGNLVPASQVLAYYGVTDTSRGSAVLQGVFNIIEAFGWWAILAGAMAFIQAANLASNGAMVDGQVIWKGFMRWIGGSLCICIGWTAMMIYQTLTTG